jgi:thioredoxin reductase (NADPH)
VHHRDGFRAAQHSVNRMRELVSEGKIDFHVASVKALHGADGKLEACEL